MQKHEQSEILAITAQELMAQGEEAEAKRLYKQAAELEEIAVNGFGPDEARKLASLGLSTAALYFKAGDYNKAGEIAKRLLSIPEVQEQEDYYLIQLEKIVTITRNKT